MMRNKDDVAAIMRKKQAAGMCSFPKGLQGLKAAHLTQRLTLNSRGEEEGRGRSWKEVNNCSSYQKNYTRSGFCLVV